VFRSTAVTASALFLAALTGCGTTATNPAASPTPAPQAATGEDIKAYAGGSPHVMRITKVNLNPTPAEVTAADTLYVLSLIHI